MQQAERTQADPASHLHLPHTQVGEFFFFSIKNNFASIANNTFWVLYVINSFICLQKMSFLPQFILPAVPLQHTTCSNIATIAFKLYKYYSVPCKYYSYLSLFSSYIFVSYNIFFFLCMHIFFFSLLSMLFVFVHEFFIFMLNFFLSISTSRSDRTESHI